jgi:predicted permease
LAHIFQVFSDNLIPILIVASAGYLMQRRFNLDPRPISIIIFNVLTPALVFNLLLNSSIPVDGALRMAGAATLVTISMVLLSLSIGRIMRLDQRLTAALILSASFLNAGNYGLSLNQIALGQPGLAWASIFFITSAVWTNSLGVLIARTGAGSLKSALLGLLRVPAIYAAIGAFLVRLLQLHLPGYLLQPVELLSKATVPLMLIVLGMQIGRAGFPRRWDILGVAAGLQLIVAPILAWFLAKQIGLTTLPSQVAVLESATPTAVLAMIIALEFDTAPEVVTSAVVVTTIVSPITITAILILLGIG